MTQELKVQEKKAHETNAETTKPGPLFVPAVDIFETPEGMTLVADMPGVNKEALTIDLKDNTLTIKGEIRKSFGDDVKSLYREYEEGDYYRQFSLSEIIDQAGITAALKNGILTLFLPKVEPAKPRQIQVTVE